MRQTLQEQINATVYQYRLIRKITVHDKVIRAYQIIPFVCIALQTLLYGWQGLFYGFIGLPCIVLIRFLLSLLTLVRVDSYQRQRWGWRLNIPFIGYIPLVEVPLGLYRKTERVIFWIGFCVTVALFPWIDQQGVVGLAFWNLWLAVPAFLILFKLRQENADGVIKLETEQIQYYHR